MPPSFVNDLEIRIAALKGKTIRESPSRIQKGLRRAVDSLPQDCMKKTSESRVAVTSPQKTQWPVTSVNVQLKYGGLWA